MQRFRSNLYNFQLVAGVAVQAAPANTGRLYLAIFNQSPNEANIQFGRPANNPSDIIMPAFSSLTWDEAVPVDSIGLYSIGGGNIVIMEGNPVP